ncbi:hypothetical protein C0J52_24540 [Blattella germanica]|nr:hypothetical protein C0J52_24540 [Blattella germanica]
MKNVQALQELSHYNDLQRFILLLGRALAEWIAALPLTQEAGVQYPVIRCEISSGTAGGGGGGGLFEPPAGLGGGVGGGGTPLSMLQLPPQTLQAIGEASSSCEPGVSTVRIAPAGDADAASLMHCREVESEAGFVCKKCRLAFPGEAGLLAHQRVACYPGKSADSRGAVRLVQVHYECKVCTAPERATPTEKMSIQEFKRHCETEAHVSRLRASPQPPPSPLQAKHPTPSPRLPPPPPAASVSPSAGLSHEMEDVVNQITLLAARAAAESTSPGAAPTDSNANIAGSKDSRDFCHPAEPKRSKLLQLHAGEVPAPVAPTCSPVAVPSTGQ